jgi:CheY-like chemotaxis protein
VRPILVVDDDLALQELFHAILATADYDPLICGDGLCGIAQVRMRHPAFILMDLQLPIVDGVTAIRTRRGSPQTEHIPIIAMSSGPDLPQAARDFPGVAILAKPFDLDVVLRLVASHLGPADDAHHLLHPRPDDTLGSSSRESSGW